MLFVRWKILFVTLSLCLIAANQVVAQAYPPVAKQPLYAEINVGTAHYVDAFTDEATSSSSNSLSYGAYIGYRLNDTWGIQGGYTYLGEISGAYFEAGADRLYEGETDALEITATYSYPITTDLVFLGSLGAHNYNAENRNWLSTTNESGTSWIFKAGLEFSGYGNWSNRIEYQYYDGIGGDSTGSSDIYRISFSVLYNFGGGE